MACFDPKKSTDVNKNTVSRLNKVIDSWYNNPIIDAWTNGSEGAFQRFYENVLDIDYDYGRMPTPKEVTRLENETNRYLKRLTKIPNKLSANFFLPENILSKNPVTKKYFDGLVRASNYYRGNQMDIKGDLSVMLTALNKSAGDNNTNPFILLPSASTSCCFNSLEYSVIPCKTL